MLDNLPKLLTKQRNVSAKTICQKSKKYDNSLDEIIAKNCYVTTELNKLAVKDRIALKKVLNFCTEQETRVINKRKTISAISLPEMNHHIKNYLAQSKVWYQTVKKMKFL